MNLQKAKIHAAYAQNYILTLLDVLGWCEEDAIDEETKDRIWWLLMSTRKEMEYIYKYIFEKGNN